MSRTREYYPIKTAPKDTKELFVAIAIDINIHNGKYTSDPYCVWRQDGEFIRWPHEFAPTHWYPLPNTTFKSFDL